MAASRAQPYPEPPAAGRARMLGAAALSAALLLLSACGRDDAANQRPEPGDRPAAKVADETIWVSDVRRQAVAEGAIGEGEPLDVASDLFARSLNEVIDQKLLAREALRLNLERDPATRRRLLAARERILGDVLIEGVVDRAVNENAIRALYQEQQKLAPQSEEVRARQIVLATQEDAEAVRKLLDTGASFEALALQRSTDQATRFHGGDLGYFSLDAMSDAYQAALQSAPPGQVVGPVAIEGGWAVLKVEDRRPEQPISLEEARPQIMRFLTYDEIRTLLTRLRGQTKVETLLGRPAEGADAPREPDSALPADAAPSKSGPANPAPAQPAAPAPATKRS